MACPAGTVTSEPTVPVQVNKPVPLLYVGLLSVMIFVAPYLKTAVILGEAGIEPLSTVI